MQKKVFITRPILSDGVEILKTHGLHVETNELPGPLSYEALTIKARGFDALITMLSDRIDSEFLSKNSHLKVISNYAVGFNNIDLDKASELKILIGNTPDVLTEATAETALGLMIAASRNFLTAEKSASLGLWKNWEPMGYMGHGLSEKTLGIVGFGRIGQRLANMCAQAFNMKILYVSRNVSRSQMKNITTSNAKQVSLSELCIESDFISLHVPMNEETKKMIGQNELAQMKKSAVLINTSRGEIIDQEALINALKQNQIFAAGLDVTDPEPLPPTNELFQLKNAIILPHIGSATFEARRAMSVLAAKNISAGLMGEELVSWVNRF